VFGAIIMATDVSTLYTIVLTGKSRATQRSSKSFQYGVVYEERESAFGKRDKLLCSPEPGFG